MDAFAEGGFGEIEEIGDGWLGPGGHARKNPISTGEMGEKIWRFSVVREEEIGFSTHDHNVLFLGGSEAC